MPCSQISTHTSTAHTSLYGVPEGGNGADRTIFFLWFQLRQGIGRDGEISFSDQIGDEEKIFDRAEETKWELKAAVRFPSLTILSLFASTILFYWQQDLEVSKHLNQAPAFSSALLAL